MEETVGPVPTCGRELLWGWWWPIGLIVSFTVCTASVHNILNIPSYRYTFSNTTKWTSSFTRSRNTHKEDWDPNRHCRLGKMPCTRREKHARKPRRRRFGKTRRDLQ
jgi:hypothetical protein